MVQIVEETVATLSSATPNAVGFRSNQDSQKWPRSGLRVACKKKNVNPETKVEGEWAGNVSFQK